jgi:hypothetical protein
MTGRSSANPSRRSPGISLSAALHQNRQSQVKIKGRNTVQQDDAAVFWVAMNG